MREWLVLPTHGVEPVIDVDEADLKVLTSHQGVDGFAAIQGYEPLIDISWDEARECVEAESRWIQMASAAVDASEFDEILGSAPLEEAGEDFDYLFRCNEVGAAGLVLVLSAAGYATCTSCRGHVGLSHGRVPQVGLGTEPERLQLLVGYAGRVGCGVQIDGDGIVWVYGRSVADLHSLAKLMLNDRAVFDALAPAPWRARALEALDYGEEFEWDDDEMD